MTSPPPSPPPPPVPTFRVRCPDDLIALAPVVIGFHPADSVVMLASDGRQPFHARVDLPPCPAPFGAAAEVADGLLGPARRNGIRGLAFVFFSDDEHAVRRVWSALRRGAESADIQVQDALRVDGRRYFPLLADSRLRAVGIPYDVSSHPFLAQAVLHGLVVEKDRAALVASLEPDEAGRREVEQAMVYAGLVDRDPPRTGTDRRRWGEWLRVLVGRHVDGRTCASADEVGRVAWAVQDVRVRDAAWCLITRADARAHREFWLDVARRVPEPLVPGPAALAGWAAWQSGNGALAWIAVDRCRDVAPGYGMASILAGCLDQAVPPETVACDLSWDEGLPA